MTDSKSINLRELALDTLLAVHREGRQSHVVIRNVLDQYFWLPEQEKAFYVRLTEGTLEYQIQLDYIINQFSKTRTGRMKPVILDLLRMAVYQMQYMNSVPDSAAVNEAVRLAARRGFSGLKGFVNGVLRSIARNRQNIRFPDAASDPLQYLEIRYSMPEYLVRKWTDEYGFGTAEKICAGFFQEGKITVRLRKGLASPEELSYLKKAPYAPDAYYLEKAGDITQLPEYQNGSLIVQDVSSQLAVCLAGIRSGDTVLDLCAAPGGKSVLAADLAGPSGKVIARDISEYKAEKIRENVERCQLDNVIIEIRDASLPDPDSREMADVVIADVPCTGYGVIGKKPDIRYRASEENQKELIRLQRKILENAVSYVKPGGRLLFSTCTFGHEENADTRAWLLEKYPLKPVNLRKKVPADLLTDMPEAASQAEQGYLQLLPGICRCDGFFLSVFEKAE